MHGAVNPTGGPVMRVRWIALIGALVLGLVSAVAPAAFAGGQKIVIETQTFSPQVTTVHVGDRVTWTNRDDTEHFLTSSGPLSRGVATRVEDLEFHRHMIPGSDYEHSFRAPGVYGYFCAIHMGMWGTIVVEP
jgi:plastocyanin